MGSLQSVSTFESPTVKRMSSDLIVCKKRWVKKGLIVYRPPEASNLELYETQHAGYTRSISSCDGSGLSNFVETKTCFTIISQFIN